MRFSSRVRKFFLTVHVFASVGWLGAVIVFLVLSLIGLTAPAEATVRGTYLVMELAAWYTLFPLALASLVSGIAQGIGTQWGLLRHYWVVFKLVITLFSTIILFVYMKTFEFMSTVAADSTVHLQYIRNASPLLHSVLALIALTTATVLAIYKPRGVTPLGTRSATDDDSTRLP
jgi:hypothetical protein